MPNTFELISSSTVGSGGAASVTFSSIPATYTDLCIYVSGRRVNASISDDFNISVNGGTGYDDIELYNSNGSPLSYGVRSSGSNMFMGHVPAASSTSNTFGNHMIYIPNYTSTGVKSLSSDGTTENNGTQIYQTLIAGKITNGAAISSITISAAGSSFVQYSSFYLYGVKNA